MRKILSFLSVYNIFILILALYHQHWIATLISILAMIVLALLR